MKYSIIEADSITNLEKRMNDMASHNWKPIGCAMPYQETSYTAHAGKVSYTKYTVTMVLDD